MKKFIGIIKKACCLVLKSVNGTKGLVSLFLAILMTPFTLITGVLLDAARLNSAVALFDEALCNASNSTLGTYDQFLRERFGLLAIAQDYSELGVSYTPQDFIAETFQKYMEENGFVLSNTYTNVTTSATGVYPLADPMVLQSQVMEYSKYTIPTKLVEDGLQLDNIINAFTEKLSFASQVFKTITSGMELGTSVTDCDAAFNTLFTEFDEYATAEKNYDTAYTEFKDAASAYNKALEERESGLAYYRGVLKDKQRILDEKEKVRDAEAKKVQYILDTISMLENEKDANGNPVDNSAQIAKIKEKNEATLKPYNDAQAEYETAIKERDDAQRDLTDAEKRYERDVNNKRTTLSNKKAAYVTSITNFATATEELGEAAASAADKYTTMKNATTSVMQNVGSSVVEYQKMSSSNNEKELKDKKDKATKELNELNKDPKKNAEKIEAKKKEIAKYEADITASKDEATDVSNVGNIVDAAADAKKEYMSSLDEFAKKGFLQFFETQYTSLLNDYRNPTRDQYKIPQNYDEAGGTSQYYKDFSPILDKEKIKTMLETMKNDALKSSFISFVKSVVAFFDALLNLESLFNPQLTATLDRSLYDNIGGLPSEKETPESPFAEEDRKLSEQYKEAMKGFSDSGAWPENKDPFAEIFDAIQAQFTIMEETCNSDWTFLNTFSKLWTLCKCAVTILGLFVALIARMMLCLGEYMYAHALRAGYFAYNLANRTKYSGSGIAGGSFALNEVGGGEPQYTFYGAEAEYLIVGSDSEILNQMAVFGYVYLLRVIFNVAFVFANSEVATLATEASAATAVIGGIGGVVVYILYIVLEPMIDAVLLVNGGTVPIIKTKIYLTPSGIPGLIGKIIGLGFSEKDKKKIQSEAAATMRNTYKKDDNYTKDFDTAVKEYESTHGPGINTDGAMPDPVSKIVEAYEFNYTNKLFMIMLFVGDQTMMERFANIVQMEATYNVLHDDEIGNYVFDLSQAYTYLRASGNFEATPFIKVADSIGLVASERVVYRGY